MDEIFRFILQLAILILVFDFGNLEKIEYKFITKIEEAAGQLEVGNGFSEDSRVLQVYDEANKVTTYKHLPKEKKGSLVFRRKGSDVGKDVIVLDRDEDRLNIKSTLEKRIFVVLKKNPDEKNQFFVFYSYIRNALANENEGIVEISGDKYKIEWDIWDHRGSKNLAVLFGWTTCSRSILVSCKPNDASTHSKSKAVILSEPESPGADYSEEKEEEEEEEEDSDTPSGRSIKKSTKLTPLSNFYPNMDYDELQTAFYLKTIKLATLSEGILFALRPSLKKLIKKYSIDSELGQQIGTAPEPEDDAPAPGGKILKRPRSVLSGSLGKALDIFTAGFPEIGGLSQGSLPTNAEATTADSYIKGQEVLEELWTSGLAGEKVFRINPNPAILLHNEITLALTAKGVKGPIPVLAEVIGGPSYDPESPMPLAKLVDVKAANILIDNILPTFTSDTKVKIKPKKIKKDDSLAILEALKPKGFSVFRFKRQNPAAPAVPGADPNADKMELLKAVLLARVKAQQEAAKKAAEGAAVDAAAAVTIPTTPKPPDAQADNLEKIKALLMARAKENAEKAAAAAAITPAPVQSGVVHAAAGKTEPEPTATPEKKKPSEEKDKKTSPFDIGGIVSKFTGGKKKKHKEAKAEEEEEESGGGGGGGGLFGGVVSGFLGGGKKKGGGMGGLFGKRSIAENSGIYEENDHHLKREAPAPHAHSLHTRNDLFSNLGWTTQQDLGSFSNEASYLLNSGTFTGWGPCKKSTDVTLADIKKVKNIEKMVELLTELMKTHCDSRVSDRVDDLISEKWIELNDDKAIVFGPKAVEVSAKPKLEVVEAEKLSIAFELSVFSKTIMEDLKKYVNTAASPVHSHASISKNSFIMMHFALNALNMAKSLSGKHYVLLTRNTILTVQTAIARVITDIIKISYQPVLTQGKFVKSLRSKSVNNLYNLIGITQFYLRGNHSPPEDGDIIEEFKTFMESNSKLVQKSTDHFTSKIKGATKSKEDEE